MKRRTIRILFFMILGVGVLAPPFAGAQSGRMPSPPPVDPELQILPISSRLFRFDRKVDAERLGGNELVAAASSAGFQVLDDRLINVEIFAYCICHFESLIL